MNRFASMNAFVPELFEGLEERGRWTSDALATLDGGLLATLRWSYARMEQRRQQRLVRGDRSCGTGRGPAPPPGGQPKAGARVGAGKTSSIVVALASLHACVSGRRPGQQLQLQQVLHRRPSCPL